MSEKPGRHRPRRLAEWLNPTGERKVHSLVDKIYKRKNLELVWEKVRRNRGSGGIDGEDIAALEARLEEQLERLHRELRDGTYKPLPVMQHLIPKAGQPGKHRALGIPTIYDRVCQQAILNRLEPIFEAVFDEASFGYRKGRSTKDALEYTAEVKLTKFITMLLLLCAELRRSQRSRFAIFRSICMFCNIEHNGRSLR